MNMQLDEDLRKVFVYPDGEQYVQYRQVPSWKSDDCEVRKTAYCYDCGQDLIVTYRQPFASCACGTTEWHF